MRRQRQRLQPTTFPFVAVLLCAMGGLILLLLVLDRRAKIVAQAQAREAWQQALEQRFRKRLQQAEEMARLLTARQAEWQQQKEKLQVTLVAHQQQLRQQMQQMHRDFSTATARIAQEKAQQAELLRQIASVEGEMRRLRMELASDPQHKRQQEVLQDRARAELLRLHEELAQLQQTLCHLQELRQRQQQTFSLIPYAGRRGENRKPLYVECTGTGLIFHPQRTHLRQPELSPQRVRQELDRRLAAAGDKDSVKERLYLFVLVRPAGLQLYYLMQMATVGLPVDMGYEFIDDDWVLDLNPDAEVVPPWRAADVARPFSPASSEHGAKLGNPPPTGPGGSFPLRPEGIAAGTGREPGSFLSVGNFSQFEKGGAGDRGPLVSLTTPVLLPMGLPGGSSGKEPARPAFPGQDPFAALQPTWPPSRSSPKPGTLLEGGKEGMADGGNALPEPTRLEPGGAHGTTRGGKACPNCSPQAGPENPPGGAGTSPAVGPLQSESVRQPAPVLSRLIGNRDWYIDLDCRATGVRLRVLDREFPVDSLTAGREGGAALVQLVTQLIARKQATVRPGEPPYRPILRFDVTPDGLRSYYAAHRHLEPLRLPMLRVNVEDGSTASAEDR